MRNTIKRYTDFKIGQTDIIARHKYLTIRARQTYSPDDPKIGFLAVKKIFKFAIQRNRAKRLMRDWACYCQDMMRMDSDYVFFAKDGILSVSRDEGRDIVKKMLNFIQHQQYQNA